ncbi:outer membrane beta-barrel protein [Sphingomonas sp. H39-1-10]|uniref:outer membrane beta-barrel protein n=1 Tax=Sphingomonas pollutisoli TaxID=3030829 RepID=UPI0023B94795|nr:outer membrane beta-barrel protein [Sphingomonas pollutisoli]MDF0486561.1 outer membrane beta-barrel protein [Sphingomonas pollutisoli]
MPMPVSGVMGRAAGARAACLLIGVAWVALPAQAEAQSYDLAASASIRYDDNLYRVPSALRKTLPDSGEEVVTYLVVRGGVATRIGVVAVDLKGTAGQRIHAYNPRFNAFNFAGSAAATYKTGQGEVNATASYLREPVLFDDAFITHKTLRSTADVGVVASRDLLGNFRVVGRAGYQRSAVDSRELEANGTRIVRFSGGLGYFSPTGNSVTLEYSEQRADGLATTQIQTGSGLAPYRSDFRERSVISYIDYHLTGITSLRGSFGYTWHDDRSILNKDGRGIQADIALVWSPLPNLVITPTFRRGFSTESRVFSNGVQVTSYGISASETLFGRVNFNLGVSRGSRRFRYDVQAPAPLALNRNEVTTRVSAGLSYATGSKFTLSLAYEHAQRESTKVAFPYVADAVTFSVTRAFGS